jgi:hypothetical protein
MTSAGPALWTTESRLQPAQPQVRVNAQGMGEDIEAFKEGRDPKRLQCLIRPRDNCRR